MASPAASFAAKRPATAYFLWLGDNRADVVKALGGVQKGSEVSKKAGEMWKALPEDKRAPYETKAKEQREAYTAAKAAQAPAKKEGGLEARKKPMSPVFAYIQEKRAEIQAMPGVKGLGDISKKGAELFKALPAEEQAQRRATYDEELKAYAEWAATDEGKAALGEKKAERKEKRDAKKEKLEKKTKKGKKTEAAEEMPKTPLRKKEKNEKPSPKRKAEKAVAPPKAAKTARAAVGAPVSPSIEGETMKKAQELGNSEAGVSYVSLLRKLMATEGFQGKVADAAGLAALEKHGGLLNKARQELSAGTAGA